MAFAYFAIQEKLGTFTMTPLVADVTFSISSFCLPVLLLRLLRPAAWPIALMPADAPGRANRSEAASNCWAIFRNLE